MANKEFILQTSLFTICTLYLKLLHRILNHGAINMPVKASQPSLIQSLYQVYAASCNENLVNVERCDRQDM
jgi:hypothetical protein